MPSPALQARIAAFEQPSSTASASTSTGFPVRRPSMNAHIQAQRHLMDDGDLRSPTAISLAGIVPLLPERISAGTSGTGSTSGTGDAGSGGGFRTESGSGVGMGAGVGKGKSKVAPPSVILGLPQPKPIPPVSSPGPASSSIASAPASALNRRVPPPPVTTYAPYIPKRGAPPLPPRKTTTPTPTPPPSSGLATATAGPLQQQQQQYPTSYAPRLPSRPPSTSSNLPQLMHSPSLTSLRSASSVRSLQSLQSRASSVRSPPPPLPLSSGTGSGAPTGLTPPAPRTLSRHAPTPSTSSFQSVSLNSADEGRRSPPLDSILSLNSSLSSPPPGARAISRPGSSANQGTTGPEDTTSTSLEDDELERATTSSFADTASYDIVDPSSSPVSPISAPGLNWRPSSARAGRTEADSDAAAAGSGGGGAGGAGRGYEGFETIDVDDRTPVVVQWSSWKGKTSSSPSPAQSPGMQPTPRIPSTGSGTTGGVGAGWRKPPPPSASWSAPSSPPPGRVGRAVPPVHAMSAQGTGASGRTFKPDALTEEEVGKEKHKGRSPPIPYSAKERYMALFDRTFKALPRASSTTTGRTSTTSSPSRTRAAKPEQTESQLSTSSGSTSSTLTARSEATLTPSTPQTSLRPPGRKERAGWRGTSIDGLTFPDDDEEPEAADATVGGKAEEGEEEDKGDVLPGWAVKAIWERSRLPREVLREIWNECDPDKRGVLDREGFARGMWRIDEELRRAREKGSAVQQGAKRRR